MTPALDPLSRTFAALAHPARRQMLARLRAGDASVQDLAQPLAMSGPAVTKHLKVLEASGLITRGRDAQYRPCHLERQALDEAADWVAACRAEWEGRLDRLEAYLADLQRDAKGKP